jgi:hypothetical protein
MESLGCSSATKKLGYMCGHNPKNSRRNNHRVVCNFLLEIHNER